MVSPSVGAVVLVTFPFSDLSQAKLRPAIVLANAQKKDWVLCQVTSNSYTDTTAVQITNDSFISGSLRRTSYVRPGKLFTASSSLIVSQVGTLQRAVLREIIESVVSLLRQPFSVEH
ncbi:MAG: type II toxin-antitoxin system PemK/MazF family toxin [Cyanobacteria bacterium J06634_6]